MGYYIEKYLEISNYTIILNSEIKLDFHIIINLLFIIKTSTLF